MYYFKKFYSMKLWSEIQECLMNLIIINLKRIGALDIFPQYWGHMIGLLYHVIEYSWYIVIPLLIIHAIVYIHVTFLVFVEIKSWKDL